MNILDILGQSITANQNDQVVVGQQANNIMDLLKSQRTVNSVNGVTPEAARQQGEGSLKAQQAGIDPVELEGWDDRNPVEKMVAGQQYRLNRTTGAYEPTNLPKDESATLTDYAVNMPNGEKRTFKVAQKDAARFATQMEVLGAQIEAAASRQESQQKFTAGENDKNRTQRRSEFLMNFSQKVTNDATASLSSLRTTGAGGNLTPYFLAMLSNSSNIIVSFLILNL